MEHRKGKTTMENTILDARQAAALLKVFPDGRGAAEARVQFLRKLASYLEAGNLKLVAEPILPTELQVSAFLVGLGCKTATISGNLCFLFSEEKSGWKGGPFMFTIDPNVPVIGITDTITRLSQILHIPETEITDRMLAIGAGSPT